MARLIFIGEKFGGRVYEFALEKTSVGRGDHNTLTLHDVSVSNSHCEILVYGTEVIVRDLGSRNGTFVNGVRLQAQQRPLHQGQVVKFGSIEARLELDSESTSNTDSDVTAFHAHARHLRGKREEPLLPSDVSMKLDSESASAPTDPTMVLSRSARGEEPFKPAATEDSHSIKTSRSRVKFALIVAILVLGMAVLIGLFFRAQ